MSIILKTPSNGSVTLAEQDTASNVTVTIPATTGNAVISTPDLAYSPYTGFRNRIINGSMTIDQRNAGAAVTVNSLSGVYPVDRFFGLATSSAGVFTLQQSSTAPAGFKNAFIATVSTASTPSSTDQYNIRQSIEGLNVSDLSWGTANAQTVTLSFWVRSSVTGTYGGSLSNSAFDRSYPFTYTINAANTFEYKTVTVAGDTSGTWLTTNGVGIRLTISLGEGSTRKGTAGAWAAGDPLSATGTINWISNAGATFYITGVQLEKGSTATPFEFRSIGTELGLCQRYFYKNASVAIADAGVGSGQQTSLTNSAISLIIPVPMRTAPTLTQASLIVSDNRTHNSAVSAVDAGYFGSGTTGYANFTHASAGAIDRPCFLRTNASGGSGFVAFSAEL
jgi:hypothetical protein